METADAPKTESAGAELREVGDHDLAVVAHDHGMNIPPPGDDQPDLPSDIAGQFGEGAREFGRDDFVGRYAAAVQMFQPPGLSGFETA